MDIESGHVTTAEAARILSRPVATVNRWALSGRLPLAAQFPGRTGPRLYRREDVEALAEDVGHGATSGGQA